MKQRNESRQGFGWRFFGRGAGALVVLAMVATGCGGDEAGSNGAAALVSPAEAAAVGGGEAEAFTPPTLEDLTGLLSLDSGQVSQMEAALANLQAAKDQRPRGRRGRPGGVENDGGGPRGGPGGDRGGDRGGFGDQRPGGGDPGEGPAEGRIHPLVSFLEECAGFLNDDQLTGLIDHLADLREQNQAEREAAVDGPRGPRKGARGMAIGRFLRDAELSDEQREAVQVVFESHAGQMRDLFDDVGEGSVSADGVTSRASTALASLESGLQGVLGSEDFTALTVALDEARVKFAERGIERLQEERTGQRGSGLEVILGLDESQVAAMESARSSGKPARVALMSQVRDDQVTWPEALGTSMGIAEQVRTATESVLTETQRTRLAALRSLLPRREGGVRIALYF